MKLHDPNWLETEVTFRPSNYSDQTGWQIRYTISRFLFAEGPSATDEVGRELFAIMADGRNVEREEDGTLFVKALKKAA